MSAAERLPNEDSVRQSPGARHEQVGLQVLEGTSPRRGFRALLPFLGPAFVASVAYIDPGNFGTNVAAGAEFGYRLLWVVLASNLIAMVMQHLSAKLGIVTEQNLPQMIRSRWPRPVSMGLWGLAELAAMATNLAEFMGGALGFNLLFGIPLLLGAALTGVATVIILSLERRGVRTVEAVISSLVAVIAICYLIETVLDRPDWGKVAFHTVTPYVSSGSILVSVGILGATVMPHVVYLHSALTQRRIRTRSEEAKRKLIRFSAMDVIIAMAIAGIVNMSMLYMAASTFHTHGFTSISDIRAAYHTLTPLLGSLASLVFGVSLLASGISSSAVGTMAGQVIMDGFVGWTFPVWVRRIATMVPAFVVIALNLPTTQTLVISQVVLSLVLPFAVLPLVYFTASRRIMGNLANPRPLTAIAALASVVIVGLNLLLIARTIGL